MAWSVNLFESSWCCFYIYDPGGLEWPRGGGSRPQVPEGSVIPGIKDLLLQALDLVLSLSPPLLHDLISTSHEPNYLHDQLLKPNFVSDPRPNKKHIKGQQCKQSWNPPMKTQRSMTMLMEGAFEKGKKKTISSIRLWYTWQNIVQ